MTTELFIIRHWDGFDGTWMDVSPAMTFTQAHEVWEGLTNGGTRNTQYNDIDYYQIFPADTQMLWRAK